ncbi:peptidoglycan-recognition protein 1-like [Macrosteles quadrilineatus]|uniref:peptidoglycan-recognition protein 1-like n=1 Tax=Macrosteles quadrilineatus TaxID=74068 RepID=UPI0023E210B3|nr:peptidoglycan-recognition protein 1-like [Macrosteles quadrilineatus]XP_054261127.1 peptidoglycan-recognition protein 1-like [Macrosteles quadrilineatus]
MVRVITVDNHGFLYLVARSEWMAKDPVDCTMVTRPFNRVVLTVTRTQECNNRTDCINQLRMLQDKHMDEGQTDIKPSFLIGGYGTVYEGRGWKCLTAFEPGEQRGRLEISFIGDFATNSSILRPPPYEMFASALTLIKHGLKNDFISQDYKLSYFMHNPFPENVKVFNI